MKKTLTVLWLLLTVGLGLRQLAIALSIAFLTKAGVTDAYLAEHLFAEARIHSIWWILTGITLIIWPTIYMVTRFKVISKN